jgi:hypothetical protein
MGTGVEGETFVKHLLERQSRIWENNTKWSFGNSVCLADND